LRRKRRIMELTSTIEHEIENRVLNDEIEEIGGSSIGYKLGFPSSLNKSGLRITHLIAMSRAG